MSRKVSVFSDAKSHMAECGRVRLRLPDNNISGDSFPFSIYILKQVLIIILCCLKAIWRNTTLYTLLHLQLMGFWPLRWKFTNKSNQLDLWSYVSPTPTAKMINLWSFSRRYRTETNKWRQKNPDVLNRLLPLWKIRPQKSGATFKKIFTLRRSGNRIIRNKGVWAHFILKHWYLLLV